MASTTGARYATGQVLSLDEAIVHVLTVGFVPRKCVVHNLTNSFKVEFTEGLASGSNIKTGADGARSVLSSGAVVTEVDADGNMGFNIPANLTDINDAVGEELLWECWG